MTFLPGQPLMTTSASAVYKQPFRRGRAGPGGWAGLGGRAGLGAAIVGKMADPRELLLAERARAVRQVAALEREFAGLAEAASAGGTDDEHDPEGATLAFERQHAAALLEG